MDFHSNNEFVCHNNLSILDFLYVILSAAKDLACPDPKALGVGAVFEVCRYLSRFSVIKIQTLTFYAIQSPAHSDAPRPASALLPKPGRSFANRWVAHLRSHMGC